MDLGVVGRHVLLFDDDDTAAFVNSGDALVDWHSLQIDRYDVRHLLSSAPPPRRRNRNSGPARLDDLSLESQLDQERYLDLPSHPDEPVANVKEDEHRTDALGYRAVSFLYGDNDDIVEKKNADAGMESSGFLPSFPIPNDLQSLPPTEKIHQIIARTALFVSKHGGQSEIILRVKQGDNPTFGFLMPGHHLHAYFRFLVEHPELVHSQSDGKFQDKQKIFATDHNESNSVNGALTLLGSVYGSEEEDDGGDNVKAEKDHSTYSLNHSISHSSKEIEAQADAAKDESISKKQNFLNREKAPTVEKNSLITTSKSGTVKGMEEKSHLFYGAADRAKSLTMGMTLKVETATSDPPPELKRLIDKLVELIMRNGKQFELTLMEEDRKHERFSFLRPSDQYHSYYSKVLQTAVQSKLNCEGLNSGKDGPLGRGVEKKATAFEEMPLESNRKEKFKMVIGKSKKETQETESKEAQQECGIDATAAAAILQAATRGINDCNSQIISVTSSTAHVNNSEDGQPRDFGNSLSSTTDNAVQKLGQSSCNSSAVEADSEARLSKEQKLKADRLKRAKMFVAMLKSGEVPFTNGISRASSLEPLQSGVSRPTGEVNVDCKKREAILASLGIHGPGTDEKRERNYFGEHNERLSKRKYRSRSGLCESEDAEEDGDKREHNGRHSKGKCGSRSRTRDESDENNNAIKTERKHHRERHSSPFSSDENENEETSEEDREHKRYRVKHLSHDQHVDECEDKYKKHKNHKCTRKKHHKRRRRTHSYADESEDESEEGGKHNRYKSKHSSHFQEEDEFHDEYNEDKNHKHRRKKHHSRSRKRHSPWRGLRVEDEDEIHEKRSGSRHHSSHGSREKRRHSHRIKESQRKLKCDTSSCDDHEHQNPSHVDKRNDESNELEEGEISSSVSEGSRGIAKRYISLEASTDVPNSHSGAPSQPSETTAGVPDDLRAKIRAMLMSTCL
ncbi:hypothetical protein OROGR_000372 [Orobanche gracilis]